MARKAKPNSRTSFQFIAPDDSAIGVEGEEGAAAYAAYMQDMDERHLNLREGEIPSYYYLRVIPLDLQSKIRDSLTTDEETGARPMEVLFSPVGRELLGEFVNRCVLGVDDHPFVERIDQNGAFIESSIRWRDGQPRPANLTEAILSEETLVINMFSFAFRASQLTEAEKKP